MEFRSWRSVQCVCVKWGTHVTVKCGNVPPRYYGSTVIVIRDNPPTNCSPPAVKKKLKNPRKKNPDGYRNAGNAASLLPPAPAVPPLTTVLITVAAKLQRLPATVCAILRGTPTLHSQNIHACMQIE
jgi:hypothetical protein